MGRDPHLEDPKNGGLTWDQLASDLNALHGWHFTGAQLQERIRRYVNNVAANKGRLVNILGASTSGERGMLTKIEKAVLPIYERRAQCEWWISGRHKS